MISSQEVNIIECRQTERTWYLHQIYHKQGLAGQVDLVRLVLAVVCV